MRAITIGPGTPDSAALEEMPEPTPDEGAILVDGVAVRILASFHRQPGHVAEGAFRLGTQARALP